MPRQAGLTERAMETQVGIRELRRRTAPLFEAAMASGDWTCVAEAKAIAETLRVAGVQCRRLAGMAEGIGCIDGIARPGHGRAA